MPYATAVMQKRALKRVAHNTVFSFSRNVGVFS